MKIYDNGVNAMYYYPWPEGNQPTSNNQIYHQYPVTTVPITSPKPQEREKENIIFVL